jgi:SNF2 family DNA or RNA helicase
MTLLELSVEGTYKAHTRKLRELTYKNAKDPAVTTILGLLAAVESQERPEAPQPAGLSCSLRSYQKQALGFCLEAERRTSGPFWFVAPIPPAAGGVAGAASSAAPAVHEMYFCPLLQRLTLDKPNMPRGGFLCEEMGLGKTVISLGLILAAPQSVAEKADKAAAHAAALAIAGSSAAAQSKVLIPSSATLVVCMVSIVGQCVAPFLTWYRPAGLTPPVSLPRFAAVRWIEEARAKLAADSELKIHMYHNTNREKDPAKLAKFDLVVTTYQTLGTDFGKRNSSGTFPPLGCIDWHRIILDESHSIKSAKVQQSIACSSLHASKRWCVSGTPMATDGARPARPFPATNLRV